MNCNSKSIWPSDSAPAPNEQLSISKKHTYRRDVDGLRALAILPVVLFHADLGCSGGYVGVDVFFVISGFLITSLILKEIHEGVFTLATFWERRIRRILPALFVVVFSTFVAGWVLYFPEDFRLIGKSIVAQAILLSNFFFLQNTGYFAAGVDSMPLLHTWSLAVEEQFYVLFPLLLILLARHKRFSIPRVILGLCIGSLALSIAGTYLKPSASFYLLPTRAWELMVGGFLAAIPSRRQSHFSKPWLDETAGLIGIGLILFAIFTYTAETRFPGLAAVPPCLGAALIIYSGARPTLTARALALRPVVFIGLISYSLYLWHWPILVFSKYNTIETQDWKTRVMLLLISILLASASWKWIEAPFRKRLVCPRRQQAFAFAGCSMLIMLFLGTGVYLMHGIPARLPVKALDFSNYRKSRAFLNEITPQQAASGHFAELGAQSTNQPIELLLWGDSHAMAVAPVLDELCRMHSMRGVEATHSATAPVLDFYLQNESGLGKDSVVFSRAVVEFIAQKKIKTVVICAKWSAYGPAELVDVRLAETAQTVMRSGAKVYVLKDVPIPGFDVPRCAALTVLHHGDLNGLAVRSDDYAALNRGYENIFDRLSQLGVTVLDTPKYFLNTRGFYDVVRDDKALYCDKHHLTIEGSKLLTPMFEPLFRKQ